jgi:hypothetical protein
VEASIEAGPKGAAAYGIPNPLRALPLTTLTNQPGTIAAWTIGLPPGTPPVAHHVVSELRERTWGYDPANQCELPLRFQCQWY